LSRKLLVIKKSILPKTEKLISDGERIWKFPLRKGGERGLFKKRVMGVVKVLN